MLGLELQRINDRVGGLYQSGQQRVDERDEPTPITLADHDHFDVDHTL